MSIFRLATLSAAFVAAVAATGCTEKVHAEVSCNVTPEESIKCTVHQDVGKAEIDVCWDVAIACANKTTVGVPHSCAKVSDGKTSELVIPKDKLTDVDKCGGDAAPTMALTNLTINGNASETK